MGDPAALWQLHAEPVGEPGGNVALPEILGRERHRHPSSERGRAAAHVDGNVVDLPFDDANQLGLLAIELQMQTAQRAANRTRMIVLHERPLDPTGAIPLGVIGLDKKPAAVGVDLRLDDENTWNLRGDDTHVRTRDRGRETDTGRRRSTAWRRPAVADRRR